MKLGTKVLKGLKLCAWKRFGQILPAARCGCWWPPGHSGHRAPGLAFGWLMEVCLANPQHGDIIICRGFLWRAWALHSLLTHHIVWIMLLGSTNTSKSKALHFCWQKYCRSSKPGPGWWRVNVLPSAQCARVHASAMKNICWLVPRLRRVWSRSSWWTRAGVRCSLPPIIADWVFEHIWTNFMHVNHPFCDTLGTWEILIILQSAEQF